MGTYAHSDTKNVLEEMRTFVNLTDRQIKEQVNARIILYETWIVEETRKAQERKNEQAVTTPPQSSAASALLHPLPRHRQRRSNRQGRVQTHQEANRCRSTRGRLLALGEPSTSAENRTGTPPETTSRNAAANTPTAKKKQEKTPDLLQVDIEARLKMKASESVQFDVIAYDYGVFIAYLNLVRLSLEKLASDDWFKGLANFTKDRITYGELIPVNSSSHNRRSWSKGHFSKILGRWRITMPAAGTTGFYTRTVRRGQNVQRKLRCGCVRVQRQRERRWTPTKAWLR